MAADTMTINSIDSSTLSQGYVTVDTTLNISSQNYSQNLVSNNTEPAAILADVTSQAEVYRNQILSTTVTPSTTISSLVGEVVIL